MSAVLQKPPSAAAIAYREKIAEAMDAYIEADGPMNALGNAAEAALIHFLLYLYETCDRDDALVIASVALSNSVHKANAIFDDDQTATKH